MSIEDYAKEHFNAGAEMVHADRHETLSNLVKRCDYLKVDTDGHDLKVLHGAEELFKTSRPLVIFTEADFHGDPAYGESSLSGIEQFLRERDYTWLDISVQRYSRAAYPQKFRYGIPATTVDGPLGFCDATFVDDPLSRAGKLSQWLKDGVNRPIKLVALYDLMGFPDCAAELIVALSRHPASADKGPWTEMLRTLDPDYEIRIARFKADFSSFY